jgi:hypothetical protein
MDTRSGINREQRSLITSKPVHNGGPALPSGLPPGGQGYPPGYLCSHTCRSAHTHSTEDDPVPSNQAQARGQCPALCPPTPAPFPCPRVPPGPTHPGTPIHLPTAGLCRLSPGAVSNVVQDAANHDVLRPGVRYPDKRGPRLGAPGPRPRLATQGLQPHELVLKQLTHLSAVGVSLGLCSAATIAGAPRSTRLRFRGVDLWSVSIGSPGVGCPPETSSCLLLFQL